MRGARGGSGLATGTDLFQNQLAQLERDRVFQGRLAAFAEELVAVKKVALPQVLQAQPQGLADHAP